MGSAPPTFAEIEAGYSVHLFGTDELGNEIDILGAVPEKFTWNLTSEWSPLVEGGNLAGALSSLNAPLSAKLSKVNAASMNLTGFSGMSPALTTILWRSSSHLTLGVDFQFNAISDAYQEVMLPSKTLSKLQLPSLNNGVMRSPGPSFLSINNKYRLNLHVSNLVFTNIVVQSVTPDNDTMIDSTGNYISATCHVTFSTSTMITKQDIDNIYSGNDTQSLTPLQSLSKQFRSVTNLLKV